jgi:peptidyl-prolyl cis-trans isomerase A (cyclophilin A)
MIAKTGLKMKKFLKLCAYSICIFATGFICSCNSGNPKVIITTEVGDIIIELYINQATITALNFLKYVEENRYEGANFYRIVKKDNQPGNAIKIEVIQGGLFKDNDPNELPPIPHETTLQTGILHKNGVVSMARNEPGTATDDFFICVGDQPELDYGGTRNPDGQGFAAFGKVISGMDVVQKIHQSEAKDQSLEPMIRIISMKLVK